MNSYEITFSMTFMSFDETNWKSTKLTNSISSHAQQYCPSKQTFDLTTMLVIAGILKEWDRTLKPTMSFIPNCYFLVFLLLAFIVQLSFLYLFNSSQCPIKKIKKSQCKTERSINNKNKKKKFGTYQDSKATRVHNMVIIILTQKAILLKSQITEAK